MTHPHGKTLLAYWQARKNGATVPARADIAASDLRDLLGHIFMLQRHDTHHHVFRLAGTRLCDLHQQELRDQNFLKLWSGYDRQHMTSLLEATLAHGSPSTAMSSALTMDGQSVDVELTFAPLASRPGQVDRILGLYQPLGPYDLKHRPIIRHQLLMTRLPERRHPITVSQTARVMPIAANDR